MDIIVTTFIESYFPEERVKEIYTSFKLFDNFDYSDYLEQLRGTISMHQEESNDAIADNISTIIRDSQDFIISEHRLTLDESASEYHKNEILTAFYNLQYLEDYERVILTTETLEIDEVKLAIILSDLCCLTESDILVLLDSVNPSVLETIKQFAISKTTKYETKTEIPKYFKKNLEIFFNLYGVENIGHVLFQSDIVNDQVMDNLLPYIKELVGTFPDDLLAVQIASLLYITYEGSQSPIEVFTRLSENIFDSIDQGAKVKVLLTSIVRKINDYKLAGV